MSKINIDAFRCSGCGRCVDFCPVEVFDLAPREGAKNSRIAQATREENCWACDTCVGQCPNGAIRVVESLQEFADKSNNPEPFAAPIEPAEKKLYALWQQNLMDILRLRWNPVAIKLIGAAEALPDVQKPAVKLRHCQSLMIARRGRSLLMPPQCHACPDGTHILGLTEIPPKLASGELYIHFQKLASMDAARRMIAERPRLPARSIRATLVTPLANAVLTPDVVAVFAQPEQMMWLTMASAFYTGHRSTFHVSGYNAQCVETTLLPYTSGQFNISLGCYGCRASSDISDDLMFMGIPLKQMPDIINGLQELDIKAIRDSRNKIYLPPNL